MQAQQPQKFNYVISGIFFAVSGAFILCVLVWQLKDISLAFLSKQWQVTDGLVIYSKAVRGCGKGAAYYPEVLYQYTVGQTRFTNSRITFGSDLCGSASEAQLVSKQYPSGSSILVHYNSFNPTESVLVVGSVTVESWLFIVMLLGFVAVSIYFVNRARRDLNAIRAKT